MGLAQYPQLSGPFSLRQQYIGQPARAHALATQAVINSLGYQIVTLDTITFDPYASSFHLASNCFVPPASGYYDFKCAVALAGSITNYIFAILKNNAEVSRLDQENQLTGNKSLNPAGSDIIYGNPSDVFTLGIAVGGAATMFLPGQGTIGTWLTVQQVA